MPLTAQQHQALDAYCRLITDHPQLFTARVRRMVIERAALRIMKLVALVGVLLAVQGAASETPTRMGQTQASFYRMTLGGFEVTALNDGAVTYLRTQVLPTATPEQIKKGLAANALTDPVPVSYNAYQ